MSNSTEYVSYLTSIAVQINDVFNVMGLTVGMPCNFLSLLIYLRLLRNKTNMGFLGIFQTLADLLVLIVFFILVRSTPFFFPQNSLLNRNEFNCKFIAFLRRISIHCSSWMNVLTTLDRFVFVLYNNSDKFKFMKDKLKLTGIILCVFVILTILDIPNFLFYITPRGICSSDFNVTISSDIISICFRIYVPFSIMLLLNIIMIRKILKSRATFKQTSRKEYYFTLAVLSYDFYLLVINFPLSIYYILYDINLYSGALNNNPLFSVSYMMFGNITLSLGFCTQTFSFFTNLAFNKLFRQEIFKFFRIITGGKAFSSRVSHRNTITNQIIKPKSETNF